MSGFRVLLATSWVAIPFATFASVGVLRWPLYWALAVLVPLSIAIAWSRR